MDIVDAQLHVARGAIADTLQAMDALGISSVLIDEFWGTWHDTDPTHIYPGYQLPNGAWRTSFPTAEMASYMHPDRFAYLVRIDRHDPELVPLMRVLASSPHMLGFRLQPAWTVAEAAAFSAGAYDNLLAVAAELGKPVFLFVPGYAELLPPRLRKFPKLSFVIDHCGMGFPGIPRDRPGGEAERTLSPGYFDEVLKLSAFPNAALKWSHAQNRFGALDFPYEGLRPFLRRAITAFGADRILWASDHSVQPAHRWTDLLHCLRDDPGLSDEEKSWVLGGAARKILRWPAR